MTNFSQHRKYFHAEVSSVANQFYPLPEVKGLAHKCLFVIYENFYLRTAELDPI